MRTLILSQRDTARLLPMFECVGVMADALAALTRDREVVRWVSQRALKGGFTAAGL